MATGTALRPPPAGEYTHLEPLPDPPRLPDMQRHFRIMTFDSVLRAHFAQRADVLISGQGYLRREAGNDAERLAPDCVVAFGVNPDAIVARNGYVISEVGKPPDFVLEVASRSTGRRDYTVKRAGYASYRVREYWRFDHIGGRYHDAALAGDRLVAGGYEPIRINEEPDGVKWGHSLVLGLDLWWEEGSCGCTTRWPGRICPLQWSCRTSVTLPKIARRPNGRPASWRKTGRRRSTRPANWPKPRCGGSGSNSADCKRSKSGGARRPRSPRHSGENGSPGGEGEVQAPFRS